MLMWLPCGQMSELPFLTWVAIHSMWAGSMVSYLPPMDSMGTVSFGRSLRLIDFAHRAGHRLGVGHDAAQVLRVEVGFEQAHIARVAEVLLGLNLPDFGQHLGLELLGQYLVGILAIGGAAHHHIADDEAFQVLLHFDFRVIAEAFGPDVELALGRRYRDNLNATRLHARFGRGKVGASGGCWGGSGAGLAGC
nr:hypothetical protein [Tanacetum cinerariifolium]